MSEMSGRVLKTESGPRVDVRARGSALGAIDGAGLAHKPRIRLFYSSIPHGLTARIPGFHPGGPGSTPGVGKGTFFEGIFGKILPVLDLKYLSNSGNGIFCFLTPEVHKGDIDRLCTAGSFCRSLTDPGLNAWIGTGRLLPLVQ